MRRGEFKKKIEHINDIKDALDRAGKHEEDLGRTKAAEVLYYGAILYEEINLQQLGGAATIDDFVWLDVACNALIRVLCKNSKYNRIRDIQLAKQLIAKTMIINPTHMNGGYIFSQYAIKDVEEYLTLLNDISQIRDEREEEYIREINDIVVSYNRSLDLLDELYTRVCAQGFGRLVSLFQWRILYSLSQFKLGEMIKDKRQCDIMAGFITGFMTNIGNDKQAAPYILDYLYANWCEQLQYVFNYKSDLDGAK